MNYIFKIILSVFLFSLFSCDSGIYSKSKPIGTNYYVAEVPSHSGKTLIYLLEGASGYQVLVHDIKRIWANNEYIFIEGFDFKSQQLMYYILGIGYVLYPEQVLIVTKEEFEARKKEQTFTFLEIYK